MQELHAAYAEQLSSRAQHEAVAAHLLAAGQWAAAAAALCSRGTALAAAAAVQLCRQALSPGAAELSLADKSRLEQQLGAAEKQLLALAAAEGLDPGAVLAAVALPTAAPQQQPEQQQGELGAWEERGTGSPRQRQRYSAQQMMAMGGGAPAASPPDLPADLAASAAAGSAPHDSHGSASDTAAAAGTTSRSRGPRQRYSLQSLLQLSAGASSGASQRLRQAIPPELQPGDS